MSRLNRRQFLIKTARAGGLTALLSLGVFRYGLTNSETTQIILVDYMKCTGCRTCEAICSSVNSGTKIKGKQLFGYGNPKLSRIRVHSYNPDMDIPNLCTLCSDAPCIAACPVETDPLSKRKALFRDGLNNTIINDPERCIGCGSCIDACRKGVLAQNQVTGQPEGFCTLCDGDPACIKHCPYDALFLGEIQGMDSKHLLHPDQISQHLIHKVYGT